MKFMQKLGKAIMLPVACLPLCGILMGLGNLLCPTSMQGGDVTGIVPLRPAAVPSLAQQPPERERITAEQTPMRKREDPPADRTPLKRRSSSTASI